MTETETPITDSPAVDTLDPQTSEPNAPETSTEEPVAVDSDVLVQKVEISDVGPCKKHIRVTVERPAIEKRFEEKYTELVRGGQENQVPGFRPGKAPRKIIERKYRTVVEQQVRQQVLMASLEQLATDNQISPLAPPDLNPDNLEIPKEGPFIYEFDIEVRPDFDLPSYKGLFLRRPVKTITEADVRNELKRVLEPDGQLIPKEGSDVHVDLDDYIIADVNIYSGPQEINRLKEIRVKVERRLALSDGGAEDFGKRMRGAKIGDVRNVEIKMSDSVPNTELRGKILTAKFFIKDIKVIRLPEMTPELLADFEVKTVGELDELVYSALERRLEYTQRQYFRQQIIQKFNETVKFDLPRDLLTRQAQRSMNRKVMEMRLRGNVGRPDPRAGRGTQERRGQFDRKCLAGTLLPPEDRRSREDRNRGVGH